MTYVKKKVKQIHYLFKKRNLKVAWESQQKRYRFSKPVKYDKQRIFVLGCKCRVDSCLDRA